MSDKPKTAADLLHTRWVFYIPERTPPFSEHHLGYSSILHHVEVVEVFGDRAIVVTCYTTPLMSWNVSVESLLIEPSAFRYLGAAEQFLWVLSGRHVKRVSDGLGLQITQLNPDSIELEGWDSVRGKDSHDDHHWYALGRLRRPSRGAHHVVDP